MICLCGIDDLFSAQMLMGRGARDPDPIQHRAFLDLMATVLSHQDVREQSESKGWQYDCVVKTS